MKVIFYILLSCTTVSLLAQPSYDAKRDYVWIFGIQSFSLDTVDHVFLDFRTDTMNLSYQRVQGQELFQTNASICDTAGNFLFFSNGCVLVDSGFHYIPGADTINLGPEWTNTCNYPNPLSNRTHGYVIVNGCWILPVSDKKYKVFYADIIDSYSNSSGIRFATVVQGNLFGELSGYNADTYLFTANLNSRKPGVVRHANGRDWWIVNEAYEDKRYYISLIDSSETIHATRQQYFNELPQRIYHGGGQACFSPDGTKYCTIDAFNHCQIFDFDRCKGELSNVRFIPLPISYDSLIGVTGIACSSNSRFMYLMTRRSIWQYDLQSNDIESSKIRVADYNGFLANGYQTAFYQSQLGPDGKIYIFPPGCRSTFSIIEHPDSLGIACSASQFKYYFPQWGGICQPPRFPNFRLGPEVGSLCDTIISGTFSPDQVMGAIVLRPNPATEYTVADITISNFSADMKLELEVFSVSGVTLQTYQVPPYAALQRIETAHLPNGVYFVALKSQGRVLRTEKLVVLRE
jgi:hypothetical protein